MFLFGITGYSGSGKTTLNEKVVECLRALGYSVSCVKDAHHQVDLDTPGKDTYRYRVSGAEQVILRTPDRWALMEETPEGRKPLSEILRAMKPVDFVLLEGFKDDGDFPRIEVSRGLIKKPRSGRREVILLRWPLTLRKEFRPECRG